VEFPRRYILRDTATGAAGQIVDLEPHPGKVVQEGTKINRAHAQPIEDWLAETPQIAPAVGAIPIADARREIGLWQNCVELTAAVDIAEGDGVRMTNDGVAVVGATYSLAPSVRLAREDGLSAFSDGSVICGEAQDSNSFFVARELSGDVVLEVWRVPAGGVGLERLSVWTLPRLPGMMDGQASLFSACIDGQCDDLDGSGNIGMLLYYAEDRERDRRGYFAQPFRIVNNQIAIGLQAEAVFVGVMGGNAPAAVVVVDKGRFVAMTGDDMCLLEVIADAGRLSVDILSRLPAPHRPNGGGISAQLARMSDNRVLIITHDSGTRLRARVVDVIGDALQTIGDTRDIGSDTPGGMFVANFVVPIADNVCALLSETNTPGGVNREPQRIHILRVENGQLQMTASAVTARTSGVKPLTGNRFLNFHTENANGTGAVMATAYTLTESGALAPTASHRASPANSLLNGSIYIMPHNPFVVLGAGGHWVTWWHSDELDQLLGIAAENIAAGQRGLVAVAPGRVAAVRIPTDDSARVFLLGGNLYVTEQTDLDLLAVGFRDADGTLIFTGGMV